MTILKTARLVLRPARESDVEGMHVLFSDAETMRYWSRPPHTSLEQTRTWMASMIAAPSDDFIIEHEGTVAGKVGAYRLPETIGSRARSAPVRALDGHSRLRTACASTPSWIGFILRRDLWRQGFAREALSAVIAHLWATHDVPVLKADVDPRNDASLGLLERLGFVRTGFAERTFCVGGQWVDSVYLTLERPR